MTTNLTKEDIAYLESKAVDEIAEFLFENEHVQTYIDTMIEETGFEYQNGDAITESELNHWHALQAQFQMKLVAKLIGIL